jgi:hypothetical protein
MVKKVLNVFTWHKPHPDGADVDTDEALEATLLEVEAESLTDIVCDGTLMWALEDD